MFPNPVNDNPQGYVRLSSPYQVLEEDAGLSMDELAKKIGQDPKTLSDMNGGMKVVPPTGTMVLQPSQDFKGFLAGTEKVEPLGGIDYSKPVGLQYAAQMTSGQFLGSGAFQKAAKTTAEKQKQAEVEQKKLAEGYRKAAEMPYGALRGAGALMQTQYVIEKSFDSFDNYLNQTGIQNFDMLPKTIEPRQLPRLRLSPEAMGSMGYWFDRRQGLWVQTGGQLNTLTGERLPGTNPNPSAANSGGYWRNARGQIQVQNQNGTTFTFVRKKGADSWKFEKKRYSNRARMGRLGGSGINRQTTQAADVAGQAVTTLDLRIGSG